MTNTNINSINKLNTHLNEQLLSEEEYQELIADWKQGQRESLMLTHYDAQLLDTQESEEDVEANIILSQERENTLKKHSIEIVQYLNAKYIIEELIEPLEKYQLIDLKKIKNVEFMYMICFRAWCEVYIALGKFYIKIPHTFNQNNKEKKETFSEMELNCDNFDDVLKSLLNSIVKLYLKADKYLENYHRILLENELCIRSKVKNIFRTIFNNQRKTDRNKFLFGHEGVEFTRQEQINYFHNFYLKKVICEIKQKGKKFETFIIKLRIYKKLLNSQIKNLQGFDDFEILKQKIIANLKPNQNKP